MQLKLTPVKLTNRFEIGRDGQAPGISHTERVRGSTSKRSASSGNGPGRCGIGAFAPRPVAPTALRGNIEQTKGRRLKLTVVRKI
jgi:hypothetical protein